MHATGAKRGKTRASEARLVLVLLVIGWEGGANFVNQSQNSKWGHARGSVKRGKTQASKSRLILVLFLIGWESDASFVNQSQSVVKQNQSKRELLSTLNWKPL